MSKPSTVATRRLADISQASKYANVHPVTIRRWIAAGHLPGYRMGPRLLKVDLNEIDSMLTPVAAAGGEG